MKHIKYFTLVFLTFIALGVLPTDAQQNVAREAYAILEDSCLGCHGPNGPFTEQLIIESAAQLVESGAVVPGVPIQSELFKRLLDGDEAKRMPLGQPPLSAAAIQKIGAWIQAGAPSWDVVHDVNFISTDKMLTTIQNHLQTLSTFDRPSARYFTTTHLYNAGEGPEVLRAAAIALSKLVNSLSWGFTVVKPVPIDAQGTIFYIDLRDYEWDTRDAWTQIETAYPYVIEFDATTRPVLHGKLTALREAMVCEVPFVHVDWFLAVASLPPLYHDILALPETESALERELGIDVAGNLRRAPGLRVMRAGTNDSGVSAHNRVVERHSFRNGAYWKSHDFASSVGQKNILQNPLSFDRDGGEVIFNLPNGLQAYYVSDATGNRIDVAPTDIVSNPAASDPAVRNGLSCIGCHTEGMKTFEDVVRGTYERLPVSATKDQVLRLYVEKAEMDRFIDQDTARYRVALEATGGIFGGIEPVHRFHEKFQEPLSASYAAASIGLETTAFVALIRENTGLQGLGLAGLLINDGNVKRDAWTANFSDIVLCVYNSDCPMPDPVSIPTPTSVVERQRIIRDPSNLVPDANLRAVIAEALGKPSGASIETEDLARLTRLDADEQGISDLRGLEYATRLERIELRRNEISDLSPIAELTRLNNIKLRGNQITDVSPLAGLINVDWLGLEENQITDVSPLKGLIKLNGIGISGNPISDVSPLASLISLEQIDAWQTPVSDFSALAKLPRLRWIELGNDRAISKIPSLKGLKALRRLEIRGCNVSDLSPLAELRTLQWLSLVDNTISDVSPLAQLTRLEHLNLDANVISDVKPLAALTRLEVLYLENNAISDVSSLAGFKNLDRLDLRNNAISDFSSLEGLPDKTFVRMEGNPGFPSGGPKITGPWLWAIVPGTRLDDRTDFLSRATGGAATELKVATNGATEGKAVGKRKWALHSISATHSDNINRMTAALGWGTGEEIYDHIVYGSVILEAPKEQQTQMLVGSDDAVKVWLNGELVHSAFVARGAGDYQDFFPVTLKQGKNALLVALDNRGHGGFSGFFGFAPDAKYTVFRPSLNFVFQTDTTPIAIGDNFTVNLNVENVTDVGGWQADLTFDPKVLIARSVTEGDFLKQDEGETFFQKGAIKNQIGKITGIKAARLTRSPVRGHGTLLSVTFKALRNGESKLTLQNFQVGTRGGEKTRSIPPEITIVVGDGAPAAPSLRPDETALLHNYPNPFNPETWIPYQLSEPADVTIHIYATSGVLVRTLHLGHQPAGIYQYRSRAAYWDGRNEVGESIASGVYFYTLTAGDFTATRKMLIRK
ncbi:T9SS type A sorting domain-containing protein [Candidatus Poribacteria bacterium]|nr:T9SS type A sorting domain-containing protein [Candidatus Poribacteria bacterium]